MPIPFNPTAGFTPPVASKAPVVPTGPVPFTPGMPVQPAPPGPPAPFLSNLGFPKGNIGVAGIKGVLGMVKDQAIGAAQQIKQGISEQNPVGGTFTKLITGTGKVLGGLAGIVTAPFAPVANVVGSIINKGIAEPISNIPAVQQFATSPTGQKVATAAETIANYANAAGVVGGLVAGGPTVAKKVSDTATQVGELPGKAKNAIVSSVVNKEKAAWAKPAEMPTGFNKASDVFNAAKAKGTDIPQVLVDNNIQISDHTDLVNGRKVFNTEDTAAKLVADAGKISSELVRPALQALDKTTTPIPGEIVMNKAIENINNNVKLPPETKISLIEDIKKIPWADSFTREQLLNEKIMRDANAKYSPVGDIATNNTAFKNKAIADAARSVLERNVPADIPVKAVNAEAAKLYQTASYLEALQGKTIPRSMIQRVIQSIAKITGAGVGEAVTGGGLLGGVGGYHLGGILERAFENLPNPVRESILSNLQAAKSPLFEQLSQYIGASKTAEATRLALPAGNPGQIPIPLPSTRIPQSLSLEVQRILRMKGGEGITPTSYTPTVSETPPLRLNAKGQNPIQLPGSINSPQITNDTFYHGTSLKAFDKISTEGTQPFSYFTTDKNYALQIAKKVNRIHEFSIPSNTKLLDISNPSNKVETQLVKQLTGFSDYYDRVISGKIDQNNVIPSEKLLKKLKELNYSGIVEPVRSTTVPGDFVDSYLLFDKQYPSTKPTINSEAQRLLNMKK